MWPFNREKKVYVLFSPINGYYRGGPLKSSWIDDIEQAIQLSRSEAEFIRDAMQNVGKFTFIREYK